MASTSFHTRSNSFPSSRLHPFASQVDEHLCRLRSSESASTSSSLIGHDLNELQDIYDCVDKLLQLPLTQQSLSQEKNKKYIHELLDGSLVLLDMFTIAKDSLSQVKESTLELQSILRRRSGELISSDDFRKYLNTRKVVKKAIHKALKNWKIKESCISDEDHETKAMVNMLREVEAMTLNVFKSLLSLISGPKASSKLSSWSLVSKLMQSKKIACGDDEPNVNEFEKMDAVLLSFVGQKMAKHHEKNTKDVQNQLKDLENTIQDLDEGIENLSRRLIKSRVSLLNILNN